MGFRVQLPVRFNDVDHAGIVYYPNFFHFFHVAFEELLRERLSSSGYLELLDQQRVGLPAVRVEADFRGPLRFGDDADVDVSLHQLGKRSVTLAYAARKAGADEPAAEGRVTCAVIDLDSFQAIDVPPILREIFESL